MKRVFRLIIAYKLLIKHLLISFLFFIMAFNARSQAKYSKFNHLTIEDGLSSNRIRCITRDSKEFVWIGTDMGLDRFDSYQVKTYRHDDSIPGAISSDILTCIYEDINKNMWFGTTDGLDLYNPSGDNFRVFKNRFIQKNSLNSNFVTGFVEDKSGNLWVVTDGNCMNKWNPDSGNFTRYPFARRIHGLSVRPSRMAAIDSKGYIWIGSLEPGITRFDPATGAFQKFDDTSPGYNSYSYKSLYIDNDDKVWIATDGIGFFSYDPSLDKFEHFGVKGDGRGTNLNFILDVIPEDNRYLLLAVDQGGINRFDKVKKTFEYLMNNSSNDEGLNNNGIWCFHKDKHGILWIGTSGGGINYYNPEKERFHLYTHNTGNCNSLSYDFTGCFYEDHEGLIWIGTDGGGVDVFNPATGKFRTFINEPENPNSISGNVIRGIAEDKDHNMWIGTWDAGLNKYERKTGKFTRYTHHDNDPSSISNKTIWNLFIDHENKLWVSIYNIGIDLFDYNKGVIKRFRPDPGNPASLSGNNCWFFYEDNDNRMWICTQNGLDEYNRLTNSFRVMHFPDDEIAAVYRDKSGRLWVGSNTEGLFLCDDQGKILKRYNSKNVLPGNRIHAITQDNNGKIWISGNQGISRLDPETNNVRNYNKEDGLQGDQFYQQSFLKTRKGELFFGGYNGFNSFYPDSLKDNTNVPPVYLTDFYIFNKPVKYSPAGGQFPVHISEAKEIKLKWNQSVFSLSFTAISFIHPNKNQYAYILEGFEKEWNYTDASRRYVTYTNLDPGEYTFKVKASNNDGIWNEKGVSLKIIISPPWWNTWWFRIAGSIIVCLAFALIMLSRVRQLKKQKALLEESVALKTSELKEMNAAKDKFFSIIAHDLKNPFNTIIGFSEMLKEAVLSKDTMTVYKYAAMINYSSVQTYRLLENLLEWASSQRGKISFNPVKINVSALVDEEITIISDMAICKNIQLVNTIPQSINISADKNMLKTILRNLITNAIKYTHKNGRVEISARSNNGFLEISVADNGTGMTKEVIEKIFRIDANISTKGTADEKGTGLGLVLCKEFVTRHGGKIWAESEKGGGSTFIFNLPYDLKPSVRDRINAN